MPDSILTREQVATHLRVSPSLLARYEERGLIRSVRVGDQQGYERREVRRIWTVVSLHRDAGINLAGIEAILHMREQLAGLQSQLRQTAGKLRAIVEDQADAAAD